MNLDTVFTVSDHTVDSIFDTVMSSDFLLCFVKQRPQAHNSPYSPSPIYSPAIVPALTQEDAQYGQKAQKKTEEKKDIFAPL